LITEMLNMDVEFFKQKVQAVAIANSVHSIDAVRDNAAKVWVHERVVNWIPSTEGLGQIVQDPRFGCNCYSSAAELPDHVVPNALPDIMKWFRSRTEVNPTPLDDDDDDSDSDDEKEEIALQDLKDVEVDVDLDVDFTAET